MLICDKRRPRTRGDTNIRPPPGGRIKTAPPASGPRLGRSLAGGLHPQNPQGCAPWCAFAHRAPAASVIQPEGFRARVRRWRGWATACGCPCPTPSPSPSPLDSVFQKQGNRSVGKPQACPPEGVSPCSGGGGQTPAPPAGRLSTLGGQRGCPRPKRATGQSASATRHPVPARRRRSALCRFIRENDSCEFGKNPALARARARLLVFFS